MLYVSQDASLTNIYWFILANVFLGGEFLVASATDTSFVLAEPSI